MSSGAYNVGVVLQAIDAKASPRECGLRIELLRRLLRQRRWVLGTVLSLAAFPVQVVAYDNAPVAVVQACIAAGLAIVLFLGARLMGEEVRARDYVAVIAIVVGVAVTAAVAPGRSGSTRGGAAPLVLIAVLGAVALFPYALPSRFSAMAVATTASAGLAFAWSDLATKLFSNGLSAGSSVVAVAWLAGVGISAVVATLSEMTAFQRLAASRVVPAVFVVETLVPILAAPILLRTRLPWGSLTAVAFYASLALLLAAIVVIGRSRPVSMIVRRASEKAPQAPAPDPPPSSGPVTPGPGPAVQK